MDELKEIIDKQSKEIKELRELILLVANNTKYQNWDYEENLLKKLEMRWLYRVTQDEINKCNDIL